MVPSITETIFDLGAQDKIIGVTRYCIHPPEAMNKTIIGGTKSPKIKLIESLNPDLILANKEENTKEKIGELIKIAPVFVSYPMNVSDVLDLIHHLALLTKADRVTIKSLIKNIESYITKITEESLIRTKVKVFCPIWKNPWMGVSEETFIHNLLKLFNFENIKLNNISRYPEVNINEIKSVQLILLPSEPYEFTIQDREELLELSQFKQTKIELIDGSYLSWHGSRLKLSLPYLFELMKTHTKILI